MRRGIFNMNDPLEKAVCNRLKQHVRGNDCDYVLASLERDFPYMSDELRRKCHQAAFEHYHTNAKGKTFARLIWMTLVHSNDLQSPIHSQLCDTFHLKDGEDVYVAFEVENPLYGIGEAHVHFAAELYYEATGVVKTKMSSDEFRKTYLIPLKILECLSLSDVNAKENVNVFLVDKNVKGVFKCRPMEVYYGEKEAKDVFYDVGCALYNQFDEARTEFYLDQYDSIAFRSYFRYNGDYGPIGDITGIVTIAPKDPKYGYQKTVRPVRISHWDGPKAMYSSPHGGLYEGFCRLVGKEVSETDINRPVYDFKTGKYEVNFYIWGQLMWTGEIKFTKTQCEFDRYLDEYIRAVNSGAIKLSEEDSTDID